MGFWIRITAGGFAIDVPAAEIANGTGLALQAKTLTPTAFPPEDHQVCKTKASRKLFTFCEDKMKRLIETIKTTITALAPMMTMLLFSTVILAQGPIFTGDAGNLSNIIREALKLMAIILFCLGAVGVAWAIYNKMTGKEWGNQAFGSLLSFAFGTIVAVFWQLAQGRAVGVDTNF